MSGEDWKYVFTCLSLWTIGASLGFLLLDLTMRMAGVK